MASLLPAHFCRTARAMPFQLTTQARFWMFSEDKLAALRRAGAEQALEKLQSAEAGSSESVPLQADEE